MSICEKSASLRPTSQSLSRAQSGRIRVPQAGLEHISEVLSRILEQSLDRQQLGKLSEQGWGRRIDCDLPVADVQSSPNLVTTSYPINGGAA